MINKEIIKNKKISNKLDEKELIRGECINSLLIDESGYISKEILKDFNSSEDKKLTTKQKRRLKLLS